ncbi:sucrase ferredoxin [Crossiella sp. CA198]|uniref:sucrase ferredoxin n=1 Tax=Crossiella sp. CA198 TaxID=3455607 RepID=UPI003F8D5634
MTGCAAWLAEPVAATGPTAATWLCLEQPGPWGRKALLESRLDPGLGAELIRRSEGTGVKVLLIRSPGRSDPARPRRVFLARTAPGATTLHTATLADPRELLDLDFADPRLGEPTAEPLLLVCTNGRRDRCCTQLGRPIAEELDRGFRPAVWECSHLGGHRFAPTGLVLPTGYSYGRLDLATAQAALLGARKGQVEIVGLRGRSTWSRRGQAAELAVREVSAELDPDALTVFEEQDEPVRVEHLDGRRWLVEVVERPLPAAPASCGEEPAPRSAFAAVGLRPV